jgi:hypothetical protein
MTASIHLGYVVGTGEPVEIPLRHTAVTGQTQESGKTTTLEGLISRSGLQAVAYVTKRGESSFHVMHPIPPYFQERADWKFVQSLLEASTETKLKFEQSWIMRASEAAKTLQDVQANIKRFLDGVKAPPLPSAKPKRGKQAAEPKERWTQKPARGLSGDVYYVLNKYLDDIMPQLAEMPYTTALELAAGLNVMDLRDYEFPLQALVIRSVTDRIRQHLEGTINIIPEAWKFAPKFRGSPVRLAAEEYVREAAAMKNFLWIDSQDLAGVADVLMRQVGVWLFGVQRATREIWRALEHMPEGLPAKRPRPADIATLSKGQFYVCFGKEMHKVYVQPAWMTAAHAEAIARDEEDVESARDILKEFDKEQPVSRVAVVKPKKADDALMESIAASAQKGLEEEAMWKEKYEALKKDFDFLQAQIDELQKAEVKEADAAAFGRKNGDRVQFNPHSPQDMNELLDLLLTRIRERKDPAIIQLMRELPEIRVNAKRHVLEMSDDSTDGRIALLISQKFFDTPQDSGTLNKEFKRRGWFDTKASNTALFKPLAKITEMGFLLREGTMYQAVPGMKINIVEA